MKVSAVADFGERLTISTLTSVFSSPACGEHVLTPWWLKCSWPVNISTPIVASSGKKSEEEFSVDTG